MMKKKFLIVNALMGLMILSAIFLQSLHAFEHLAKEFSETKCLHAHHEHKHELTHGHDGLEKCFVCEFAFSNSVEPNQAIIVLESTSFFYKPSFFSNSADISFFNGSASFLRGPPQIVL